MSLSFPLSPRLRRHQQGVGLVELMISITIGLLLVVMVTSYYLSSRQSYQVSVASSEVTDSQRYAMQLLVRQLLLAGYSDSWMKPEESFPADAAEADRPAFKAGQVVASGDSNDLWLRMRAAALDQQPVVGCTNQELEPGDDVVTLHLFVEDQTLYCQSDIPGSPVKLPLLNAVDGLAFAFLDDSDTFQAAIDVSDWLTVRAVRIELLIRSETATQGASYAQTFTWPGGDKTFDDNRMHSRVSRVATLRNAGEVL